MKSIVPMAAGLLLIAAIPVAVKQVLTGPDGPAAAATAASTRSAAAAPAAIPARQDSSAGRRPAEVPAAAREFERLWARGRAAELLPALDRLSAGDDEGLWRDVAPVLVRQAAMDGRHEVAGYLLATGDSAPAGIRLEIYAAALENPDEGIRAAARLELENLTGVDFASREEARAWIAANASADEVVGGVD